MTALKLSERIKESLVVGDYHAPRSVLGFHELTSADGSKTWIVRALEPDAVEVKLVWEGDSEGVGQALRRIHPGGLFELVVPGGEAHAAYTLEIEYSDGTRIRKHDPYYFAPQLSELDLHLFGEGNHHRIYHKLGAHATSQDGIAGTLFAVWAPTAKRVSVVGEFNFWDGRKHPMQVREASGIWELFIPGVGPGDLYKYEIKGPSGHTWLKADPYGFAMQLRPDNCSVVADLEGYEWQDTAWMERRASSDPLGRPMNVYEVHPGSWKRAVEEDNRFLTWDELAADLIPYVQEMGYTHIELMGVAEHPYDASWGYQVVGYYAATSRFGSPQSLMRFVDRCHQADIGVFIDWVPAHFPKDAHGLVFFDGTHLYEHSDPRQGEHQDWGTKIFNYGRNEVRNFLVANALYWLDCFHVDGLRVDAVASMLYLDYSRLEGQWVPNQYGGRENLDAVAFLRELNHNIARYYPGVLTMAEESTAFPGVTHPSSEGGLGFSLKWNMGWMNDSLEFIELDPIFRKYNSELITFSLVYAFSEKFMLPLSHDEFVHGKRSLLSKMPGDDWQKRAHLRLFLTYHIAHPGKKLLFMGGEFGQWREWTEAQSLDWHLLDYPWHAELQAYCKSVNRLYREHAALWDNDFDSRGFEWLALHDADRSVYAFLRRSTSGVEDSPLVFVFNFTPVPRDGYPIGVPDPGEYRKLLDSDAEEFGGSAYNRQESVRTRAEPTGDQPLRLLVDLPPLGAVVLRRDGAASGTDTDRHASSGGHG